MAACRGPLVLASAAAQALAARLRGELMPAPGEPSSHRRTSTSSPPPCLQGDDNLRSTYSACMQQLLAEQGARPVRDILDVGASTGLSSLALLKAFPDAHVTGAPPLAHVVAPGRAGRLAVRLHHHLLPSAVCKAACMPTTF